MKILSIALLLLPLTALGQEAECPKTHAGAPLTNASAMWAGRGEESAEFHGGDEKPVKGGVDIDMPTNTRWLVCWYGKGRSSPVWMPLEHDPDKIRGCTMKIRGKRPVSVSMVCK